MSSNSCLFAPSLFNLLSIHNLWYPFLQMRSVLSFHFKSLRITTPSNLYFSTTFRDSPAPVPGRVKLGTSKFLTVLKIINLFLFWLICIACAGLCGCNLSSCNCRSHVPWSHVIWSHAVAGSGSGGCDYERSQGGKD